MRGRWSWLALGGGAYLAFLLTAFPAGTAYRWFAPADVELSGLSGTLWSGGAAAGSIGRFPVRDFRWRLRPWSLLLGRIGAQLDARLPDGVLTAQVTATPSCVVFADLRFSTSIPSLQEVLPIRGVEGLISVALTRLELERGWPTKVIGDVRLTQIQVPPLLYGGAPQLLPLGDYTLRFAEGSGQRVAASIRDDGGGGPFEVAGTLALDAGRAYAFDALIKPRAGASDALVQGLVAMSADLDPDPQGRYRLTLMGTL